LPVVLFPAQYEIIRVRVNAWPDFIDSRLKLEHKKRLAFTLGKPVTGARFTKRQTAPGCNFMLAVAHMMLVEMT
jgi:hypothetical protein